MTATLNTLDLPTPVESQADRSSGAVEIDPQTRRQAALVALGRRAIAPPEMALLIQDGAALLAETLEVDRYGAAELNAAGTKLKVRMAKTGALRDQFIENQTDFNEQLSLSALAIK